MEAENRHYWPLPTEPSSSNRITRTLSSYAMPLNLEVETTDSLTAVAGHICVSYRGSLICWGGYCYDEREIHYRECNWLYIFPYKLCGVWRNNVWLRVKCETDLQLRPNSGATAGVYQDQLFIFGGCLFDDVNRRMINTSMLLAIDLRNGTLAAKHYPADQRIPTPRDKTTSWIADDKFFIFGGYGMSWHRLDHGQHQYFFQPQSFLDDDMGSCWNNQMLFYDLRKECWREVEQGGKKPSQRAAAASVYVPDLNQVFLFGGRHAQTRLNDLYLLDLATHVWSQIDGPSSTSPTSPWITSRIPEGRSWCTMTLLSAQKKVLCYGGLCSRGQPLRDLWELDISKFYDRKSLDLQSKPHWRQIHPLDHQLPARLWHCAVLMDSEVILIYGGMNEAPSRDSPFVSTLLVQRLQPPTLGQLAMNALATHIVDSWMAEMNTEKAMTSSTPTDVHRLQLPVQQQSSPLVIGHLDVQCFASVAGFLASLPSHFHSHLRILLSIRKHARALDPTGGSTPRSTSPSHRSQPTPVNFHLLNLDGMIANSDDDENQAQRLGRRSHRNVPLSPKSQKRALADELVKQIGENAKARGTPFLQALFNAFDPF